MSQRPLAFIIPIPNPLSSLLLRGRRADCVGDGRTGSSAPTKGLPHIVLSLSFRAQSADWRGNPSPFHVNSGQRPPPTFAAPRQRRDLIIANPRRVFPKREGRSPPSLVAQGRGIFKGEGRPKLPSPLNGVLWILSFAKERKYPAGGIPRRGAELPCLSGKQVTRRRQKEKMSRAGQSPAPTHHLPKASTFLTATAPQIPRRGAASPPAPPTAARSSPPRPRCRTPRTWPPAPPAAAAPPGPPRFSAQARCVPRR